MKSYLHAKVHVKKYGGVPDDYVDIDDFIDSSKQAVADVRHRAILHSAFGCFIVEQVFGRTRINSAGREYSPRDIAEDHIQQDVLIIPTAEHYLKTMDLNFLQNVNPFSIEEHSEADSEIFKVPVDVISPIHKFMESSYIVMPDTRHKSILHHSFGIFIAERIFGLTVVYGNKKIPVREIITNHLLREFGFAPTLEYFLSELKIQTWMSGSLKHKRKKLILD